MVRLKWLKIDRYRHVRPGVELYFNDRINVLLGLNGTGKTTLLDLISMIVRSDFSSIATIPYSFEYRLQFGNFEEHGRFSNVAEDTTPLTFGLNPPRRWKPRAEVMVREVGRDPNDPPRIAATTESETTTVVFDGTRRYDIPLNPHLPGYVLLIAGLGLLGSERSALHALRFDEALGVFDTILTGAIARLGFLVDKASGHVGGLPMFVPSEFSANLTGVPAGEPLRGSRADNAVLETLAGAFGFDDIVATAEVGNQSNDEGSPLRRVDYRNFRFRFVLSPGNEVPENFLSYGQKRLFSFLYYLHANQSTVIADELVNGLHHRWIKLCLEEIDDWQAFLTSQNPLLFDYLEFETPEDVRSHLVLCTLEPGGARGRVAWSQMSDEQAARVFGSYKQGIRHVSEILLTEGLW